MRMPSAAQRRLLDQAASLYQKEISRADSFLNGRGIDGEVAERWRLGVVCSPEPGHENVVGRLAIPYQNLLGVIGFNFRCIQAHDCKGAGCKKYLSPHGQETYLFNVGAVDCAGSVIHIAEGEPDTIVLSEAFGEPAVGLGGVDKWQAHWPFHFQAFDRVLAWPDGDQAGRGLAARLRKEIPGVEIVQLPTGKDVNEVWSEAGTEALRALAGSDEPEAVPNG